MWSWILFSWHIRFLKIIFQKNGGRCECLSYLYNYSHAHLYVVRTESRKWRKKRQCAHFFSLEWKKGNVLQVFYLKKLYHSNLFFSFTVIYLCIFMTRKRNFTTYVQNRIDLIYSIKMSFFCNYISRSRLSHCKSFWLLFIVIVRRCIQLKTRISSKILLFFIFTNISN